MLELTSASSLAYETQSTNTDDHGLKVIIESEAWRFISDSAHFGIYNKKSSTAEQSQLKRKYKFKVSEIKEEDLLPQDIKEKFLFFESIFKGSDAP